MGPQLISLEPVMTPFTGLLTPEGQNDRAALVEKLERELATMSECYFCSETIRKPVCDTCAEADRDRVIESQAAKIAELEQRIAEMNKVQAALMGQCVQCSMAQFRAAINQRKEGTMD